MIDWIRFIVNVCIPRICQIVYYPWHQSLKYNLYSAAITDEVKQPKFSNSQSTSQTKCTACRQSNIHVSEKSKNALQLGMNDFLCSLMILEYWRWYLHWRYSVNHSRWMGNSVQPGNCFHLHHCWFAAAIQINNHLRTGLMNEYSLQFLSQLIKIFNLTLNTTETKKGGDIHMSGIFIMFLST